MLWASKFALFSMKPLTESKILKICTCAGSIAFQGIWFLVTSFIFAFVDTLKIS